MCNGAKCPVASHIKLTAILNFFIFKCWLKDHTFHSFKQIPASMPSDHRQSLLFQWMTEGNPYTFWTWKWCGLCAHLHICPCIHLVLGFVVAMQVHQAGWSWNFSVSSQEFSQSETPKDASHVMSLLLGSNDTNTSPHKKKKHTIQMTSLASTC